MFTIEISPGTNAGATGAGTATDATALLKQGREVYKNNNIVAAFQLIASAGTPVCSIEGSFNNSNWVVLRASTATTTSGTVTVYPYMRVNVTTAGTAGTTCSLFLGI